LSINQFHLLNKYYEKKVKKQRWSAVILNKRWIIPMGQSKMDIPEKQATYGTQDEDKQN